MNEICTVYREAEATCAAGGHTISVDEMTRIRALVHKYPDRPVIPRKATRMEFEYIRHGTTPDRFFLALPRGVWNPHT